ncbi:hypothetical protein D3C81_405220 [compost metagenome]
MMTEERYRLWERAIDLEKQISVRKREAFSKLKASFSSIKQKNFGNLARAGREGKLPNDLAAAVAEYEGPIIQMVDEAKQCRQTCDLLLRQERESETRPLLNPAVDPIPEGFYKKLKDCKSYPLRRCCNYGENAQARWDRCEFMKHSGSPSDPNPWHCTAPD